MALSNGASVIISGSQQLKVDSKVHGLRLLYPDLPASNISGLACDLADTKSLEANLAAFFDKVTANGAEKVDHIAFTAGDPLQLTRIDEVTVASAMAGFHVRFLSAVIIEKLLSTGRYMPQTSASSFTLTSGTNTTKPLPGWSAAAVWGAAVEGLSRGLAVDSKPIRVNVVAPGTVDTPVLQAFVQRVGPEVANSLKETASLLGTWGSPADVAEAYAWCMRDRWVTGTRVESNGGRLLV